MEEIGGNRKEIAQTMNQKLCHHFTMRINKRYFTSLKLSFGILVNTSDSIIYIGTYSRDRPTISSLLVIFDI